MMRKMRCRSSDRHPEQRGSRPFGASRPFGPGSKAVDPQIGHAGGRFRTMDACARAHDGLFWNGGEPRRKGNAGF
jgi:hypothetical protein